MGLFGYMCPHCGKSIRYNEQAVLRHIQHGKLLGQAVGIYDGYGRVGGSNYRCYGSNDDYNTSKNTHESIWYDEFCQLDSQYYNGRIYKGKPVTWEEYLKEKGVNICSLSYEDRAPIDKEWLSLQKYSETAEYEAASGTSAYHKYCFDHISEEEKNEYILSDDDPEQSCGKPRKKYM